MAEIGKVVASCLSTLNCTDVSGVSVRMARNFSQVIIAKWKSGWTTPKAPQSTHNPLPGLNLE
jgi:hypothetical protein